MSRDKQIEEIVKDICPFYKEYGTCEQCNSELYIDDEPCYWECIAKCIVRNGYRKASDVAREISELIDDLYLKARDVLEKHLKDYSPMYSYREILTIVDILHRKTVEKIKTKYESEEIK